MSHQEFDIIIVGLGPAGATLARLLSSRYSVLALDKKETGDESFHKPCGGLLAPDAQKTLARFGLSLPLSVMVSPQIFAVRTIDMGSCLERTYQRHYINLDRHAFDMWLISLIPDKVDVRLGVQCKKVQRKDGGYICHWLEGGLMQSAKAQYVVGADGAASVVRRNLFPNHTMKKYIAIQEWFVDTHPSPFYSCLFDSSLTDCYAWGLTKDDYFIFGGAFAMENGKKNFEMLKERARSWGFQLDRPIKTEGCQVLRPHSSTETLCGNEGSFFVGESAGFISPSSLEGLSYAFDSALKLACVFNDGGSEPNARYDKSIRLLRAKLALKNVKSAVLYTPFLRRMIMQSGLQSISLTK